LILLAFVHFLPQKPKRYQIKLMEKNLLDG